jgi:hypothetical protein
VLIGTKKSRKDDKKSELIRENIRRIISDAAVQALLVLRRGDAATTK